MNGRPKEAAMFIMKFLGESKPKAVENAIEYWRQNLKVQMDLQQFISMCRWKRNQTNYIIIYKGPAPCGQLPLV
jgi:hypothetical protein